MAVKPMKQSLPADIPPITYGVWIQGMGWLRDFNNRPFADPRIQYAQAALRMWTIGDNTPARIDLIDDSMIGLQQVFLERERLYLQRKEFESSTNPSFKERIRRWINGLLG